VTLLSFTRYRDHFPTTPSEKGSPGGTSLSIKEGRRKGSLGKEKEDAVLLNRSGSPLGGKKKNIKLSHYPSHLREGRRKGGGLARVR